MGGLDDEDTKVTGIGSKQSKRNAGERHRKEEKETEDGEVP